MGRSAAIVIVQMVHSFVRSGAFMEAKVASKYNDFFFCTQAAKEAKAKIPPWELFKHETDKYSQFDEQVS